MQNDAEQCNVTFMFLEWLTRHLFLPPSMMKIVARFETVSLRAAGIKDPLMLPAFNGTIPAALPRYTCSLVLL